MRHSAVDVGWSEQRQQGALSHRALEIAATDGAHHHSSHFTNGSGQHTQTLSTEERIPEVQHSSWTGTDDGATPRDAEVPDTYPIIYPYQNRLHIPSGSSSGRKSLSNFGGAPPPQVYSAQVPASVQRGRQSSANGSWWGSSGGGASQAAPPPTQRTSRARSSIAYQWLVPESGTRYSALWTSLITLCCCFLFAFMAGQATLYKEQQLAVAPRNATWGPDTLWQWLTFWRQSPEYSFDFQYLYTWGGRYAPAIAAGEVWRLFSSILLHSNFSHLLSNMVVFVVLAVQLEHTYGPIRTCIIFVASGMGGNFLSMAFEDTCTLYVGASGAVFGFIGLYVADIILNFETMVWPVLRLCLMGLSIALLIGMEYVMTPMTLRNVSHLSHVGGLVSGLFVSFLFLPNFQDRRWRAARDIAQGIGTRMSVMGRSGFAVPRQSFWSRHDWLYALVLVFCVLVGLFFFVGLPVYLWMFKLKALDCPTPAN